MNSRDANTPLTMSPEELVTKLEAQTYPKVHPQDLEDAIDNEEYHVFPGSCLTVCVLTLKNGFTVSGESACAHPANFNADIGRTIARRNAKDKIWALLGYVLREKLALVEQAIKPTVNGSDVKTYVGTKIVHAFPMNRATYNLLRKWELPADENEKDEGYLVEYADGGAPNFPPFVGYVSWSPKEVFEKSYKTL